MTPTTTLLASAEDPSALEAPRPLRVLHLAPYYFPSVGGIERAVRTLSHGLAAEGLDVRVLTVNQRNARGRTTAGWTASEVVRDNGVLVVRLGRWGAIARLDCANAVSVLARLLHDRPPDLLHLHAPNPLMEFSLALLRPRAPLVVTHHCDIVRKSALYPLQRIARREVYGRAGRILVTSPVAGDDPSESLQPYRDKLSVLPLGVRLAPFLSPSPRAEEFARKLRSEHGRCLWLTVSRLVYYKGLEYALAGLRSTPGKLLIVGAGPLETELRRRAEKEGVADRVVWLGRLDDEELAGAYHAAAALWFPSNVRSEAFGLVQVEAMASGCPVINCDIPGSGVSWVSRHEESGWTIPPNDPVALSQAARRLHDDAALRTRLGNGGRKRARAEFSAELMAERTLDVYHEVLREAQENTRLGSRVGRRA
jgi:rhamnosyl/mannosyltransferase